MEKLENDFLEVRVSPGGAELQSILFKGEEKLWQGDPAWWARKSPVLFPVVGKCYNNRIVIDGAEYPMPQHGFARDSEFTLIPSDKNSLLYRLDAAHPSFPFGYQLDVEYTIYQNKLRTEYRVKNTGEKQLFFSIGAHPGFLLAEKSLDAYSIRFNKPETGHRHLLDNGLFNGKTLPVFAEPGNLPLSKPMFDLDAVVLQDIRSNGLILSGSNGPVLEMYWENMPHIGIWTKPGCDEFLCLEPWAGYADKIDFTGEFSQKPAIQQARQNETRMFAWEVIFRG